ncbi:Autophagy-related protein 27 [Penicillium paradoxum]|uniref:Autophagy-related protein 27 n=1 Tax=Penicillium paradoxum TaxID=176176 RepID=UPI0025490F5B|nr:Autophagy-related protein 27 [Penicillium paradoxum]KAJ5780029.1 Autophagy-related protein 27 [Penicillium paradoxum]
MRLQLSGVSLLLSAALSSVASASSFDCAHIEINNYKYDLSPLKGVHEVTHSVTTDNFVTNTTYRLNICNILDGAARFGDATCEASKNVCGFVHRSAKDGNGRSTFGFPIVGLDPAGQGSTNPEMKRLKEIDPETEGLRIRLEGGSYKGDTNDQKAKKAAAIIEFQCDHERSGLEGLRSLADDLETKERRRRAEGEGDGAVPAGNSSSLQFKSFGPSDDDTYILGLDWRTKYACDEYEKEKGDAPSSNSWGFFTWLIIIAFLCIAAYLIFGSWLNYNRYGARGWDLLPHSDTIRELPYLFQDWIRRVINSLQGAGSRGGYSAV